MCPCAHSVCAKRAALRYRDMITPTFPVTAIHQVELTSRCNLRCVYCVHPIMPRPKMDMSHETFLACLHHAKIYVQRGTQREFNLCGIGESTLHPRFAEYVGMARRALGNKVDVVFATNGLEVTEELAAAIAPFKPKIGVSLHRPEKAGPAIEILKRYGLVAWIGSDAATHAVDWAGQVKWHVSVGAIHCPWVSHGRVFVLADGRMSACCFDGDGSGVFGSIETFDETVHRTAPYKLCPTCHQTLDIPGYEQRAQSKEKVVV